MRELDRLIFEDFVLYFFNINPKSSLRPFCLPRFMPAFPEGEVCDEILETFETASCGCCSHSVYLPANYIER